MTLRVLYVTTDATVLAGVVGTYAANMLPVWAAGASLLYLLMLIGEWFGLWRRPRR